MKLLLTIIALAWALTACDKFAFSQKDDPSPGFELDPRLLPADPGSCASIEAVGGIISGERLLPEGSCYVVEEDILVTGDLAVEPGVRIGVADGKSIEVADGATVALVGTSESPIELFGSTPDAATWDGIRFQEGSQGVLDNTVIEGAGGAPHCCDTTDPAAIYVDDGAHLVLEEVIVDGSNGWGLDEEPDAEVEGAEDELTTSGTTLGDKRKQGEDDLRENGGVECVPGKTQCQGDKMVYCIADQWQTVKDCGENINSGKLTCSTYDATPMCVVPPPHQCSDIERMKRSGLFDPDWNPSTKCKAPHSCADAPVVGCMQTNVTRVAETFSGQGTRRIRFELYDLTREGPGPHSVTSSIGAMLRTKGDYKVRLYHGLVSGCEQHLVEALPNVPLEFAWVNPGYDAALDAIFFDPGGSFGEHVENAPYWAVLEVKHMGDEGCEEPWELSVGPNICPSLSEPAGGYGDCPETNGIAAITSGP